MRTFCGKSLTQVIQMKTQVMRKNKQTNEALH